ncbi:MAG: response regulator [Candidatus Thiodiazotropha lotti]|nr:response regulator [Candidatus Thiodiazotropha lotti]MCG8004771.1 response regulator [Candidatus Thiodiazotropha lotti]MCW4188398.1 response regulator [Candidatus Thiodiazotropha lotti]MCW4200757.1 response regulator [Candidatus Thiodiazotropha lotti]
MSTCEDSMDHEALQQLPKLLDQLKSNWPILPSGLWNSSCIQTALRLLHELSRTSKASGLVTIFELCLAIEKVISDIHEEHELPDRDEMDQLSLYLAQLTEAVEASSSGQPHIDLSINSCQVIYLPRNNVNGDLITTAIEKNGWSVRQLADIDSLESVLINHPVDLLLLDTRYLPFIDQIKLCFSDLNRGQAKSPELVFISNACDVETRLEVLRAGSSQCYSEPINVNELMAGITHILSPELNPRYRVLVVEDDESQAEFARKLLKKGGFETLVTTDPMNVMEAVEGFQPDLVLMDLYMPGANGIELTQLIRAKATTCFIPIVFLSGEEDIEKKILALHSGADDYLTKPVRAPHLIATVQTRIMRAKQILSYHETTIDDAITGVVDRRRLLDELDLCCTGNALECEFMALFLITLESDESLTDEQSSAANHALISLISDVLNPLLGKRDLIARTGNTTLGILIKRELVSDIDQLGRGCAQQITDELSRAKGVTPSWGIGLVMIDSSDDWAYAILQQAEFIANAALEQAAVPYLRHDEPQIKTPIVEKQTDLQLRDQVRSALQIGAVEFHEQRYMALHEAGAIIEQIPGFSPSTGLHDEIGGIYQSASQFDGMGMLNRLVCKQAIRQLGASLFCGNTERILIWMSGLAIHDDQLIPFIQSELRRLHVVGTGLIIEFDLPAIAPELKAAKRLLNQLSRLGIAVLLGNFSCNETAYKVLAYLSADGVRLHPSLMRADQARVSSTRASIKALDAFIMLPRSDLSGHNSHYWSDAADYVQVEHLAQITQASPTENLTAFE